MRTMIYYTAIILIFTVLIVGMDGAFGSDVKMYSTVIFFLWIAELVTKNWERIVEFFNTLYGIKK